MLDVIDVPKRYAPYLFVGTCSWKFDSWKGLVYDATKRYRAHDFLPDYARLFKSVEIDQWFWSLFPGGVRLPEDATVQSYRDAVPDDFVFTVKAPNSLTLTHFYAKQPRNHVEFAGRPNIYFLDVALLQQFIEKVAPLGKKLGPIMFQFEYLNRRKMPSLDAFTDRFARFISEAPPDFDYGIEIRNPEYLGPEFFDFLTHRRIGYVGLDGYHMPPIDDVFARYQPATTDWSVIRLHGPDRLAIEKETGKVWDRVVAPKPDRLRAVADIVRRNTSRGARTFVNVNNHFEGCAPVTIHRFLQILREDA